MATDLNEQKGSDKYYNNGTGNIRSKASHVNNISLILLILNPIIKYAATR